MTRIGFVTEDTIEALRTDTARDLCLKKTNILPFVEFPAFLAGLFETWRTASDAILSAGHISPDVGIAADRAGLRVSEVLGRSPFVGDLDAVIDAIPGPDSIVYISNPNRTTGANYGLADLEMLANAVPDGLLVVDEYFFDFYGITAAPLVERYDNVVVLRSYTAGFSIPSSECGFCAASEPTISRLEGQVQPPKMSKIMHRIIAMSAAGREPLARRLSSLHEESLWLAKELSGLGIQCRITPTDFLLIRVKDPAQVGNSLARYKVSIENLDGYPELEHYLRYRIQSEFSNRHLLNAFRNMPTEYYRLDSLDRRAISLRHRGSETTGVNRLAARPAETQGKREQELVSVGDGGTRNDEIVNGD